MGCPRLRARLFSAAEGGAILRSDSPPEPALALYARAACRRPAAPEAAP